MIFLLQAKSEKDQTGDNEWRAEPDNVEASLGLENAMVAFHRHSSYEIMEPMPGQFPKKSGDDGSKIKETCGG